MEYILGIDIGTGSTKVVALNLKYEPIGSYQQHYQSDAPVPGYNEQEPELIWNAFSECICQMIAKLDDKITFPGRYSFCNWGQRWLPGKYWQPCK